MNTEESKSHVLDLPILKHFDDEKGEISLNPNNWRNGEKGLNTAIKLALFAAVGYGAWVYILPPLFTALGQIIALAGVAIFVVFFILMLPVIFKGLRRLTRALHKSLIKYDPFGELHEQKQKMLRNRKVFKESKAKIKALKSNMEAESFKAEKEAKEYQDRVVTLQKQAQKIKTEMERLVGEKGSAGKDTDEYVELHSALAKKLSESQRVTHQLEQSKSFIQKYGSRANVMGKLDRKLTLAGTAIDIKISDFEVTIQMLEKEYAFAKSAREATEGAKSAMHFTKDWELEYALDVITETIAMDIARTQENLSDIDMLTSKYDIDSDELYSQLDTLADKIKTGKDYVPDSKKYKNPNYKLTQEDKQESGGFGNMFD
ncbi:MULTISPECIES: MgtC/SapB family protein [Cellulophaga]|jgi:hypothetical protein|uniref:Uncharacterized protein n=2 Tax=Cellulophaga baltica TaxID=76594 RepID=A0A1G7DJ08_9FLAO|nr:MULTISPECIES: hypothetical protein [Cellulophaga]WFO14872.1 hypothetical protein M601_013220 [Cellulophaga baltica 4]AIZ41141.1 hypothetical protein M666_05900 [Cellulophaga baltica 18]KGK32226.1 hypothetical protein EL45_02820 [Cellulophaga sp. E6(2014)]MCR1023332.1 hypothetical protein [Cellulophaga baltica]SDE51531.1 hypothetical protein SAMN04487992_101602 [Cellulophaga baltica]